MRLFNCITYKITKNDAFDALFERAVRIANKTNPRDFKRGFYFADSGFGKVSAVARAIKKFSTLEKFKFHVPEKPRMSPAHDVLSNLSHEIFKDANPSGVTDDVDLEVLQAIARGIPRAFPFMYSAFMFDQIDWFGNGKVNAAPAIGEHGAFGWSPFGSYFSPSIILQNNWGMSKRDINFHAVIEIDLANTADETPLNQLAKISELTGALGSIKNQALIARPSDEEKNQLEALSGLAQQKLSLIRDNLDEFLSKISLPHDLSNFQCASFPFENVSTKKSLISVFKPLGFNYLSNQSGLGVFCLAKKTKMHNQVFLLFDFAPIGRTLSFSMWIQGPLWKESINLKLYPGIHVQCDIADQEAMDKAVQNAGVIAKILEETIVPEVEKIYGPAPAWFEYQR